MKICSVLFITYCLLLVSVIDIHNIKLPTGIQYLPLLMSCNKNYHVKW